MDTCSSPLGPFTSGATPVYEEYGVEVTVTGYTPPGIEDPDGNNVVKLAGPWHSKLRTGPGSFNDVTVPVHGNPAEQIRVILEQVVPAQPGWLVGRMRLEAGNGQQLGSVRPFLIYARECDVATHTYFVDTHPEVGGAFSVGVRVTREP